MNTLIDNIGAISAINVSVTDDNLAIELSDGRTITAPVSWYPRLLHATKKERLNWRWIGTGKGVHWPDIDEDISIENVVLGKPSMESQDSLKKWLNARNKK